MIPTDAVFAAHDATCDPDTLCAAAFVGGRRAALADLATPAGGRAGSSGVVGHIVLDEEARALLEAWATSYAHDERVVAALPEDVRAEVFASLWRGYQATVLQAIGGAS